MKNHSIAHPPGRSAQSVEGPDQQVALEHALATLRSHQGMDLSPRQQREHRALAGQVFLCRLHLLTVQRRGERP